MGGTLYFGEDTFLSNTIAEWSFTPAYDHVVDFTTFGNITRNWIIETPPPRWDTWRVND